MYHYMLIMLHMGLGHLCCAGPSGQDLWQRRHLVAAWRRLPVHGKVQGTHPHGFWDRCAVKEKHMIDNESQDSMLPFFMHSTNFQTYAICFIETLVFGVSDSWIQLLQDWSILIPTVRKSKGWFFRHDITQSSITEVFMLWRHLLEINVKSHMSVRVSRINFHHFLSLMLLCAVYSFFFCSGREQQVLDLGRGTKGAMRSLRVHPDHQRAHSFFWNLRSGP